MGLNAATLAAALFWTAGAALFYTFAGYAWLMRALAKVCGSLKTPPTGEWPAVTCVVVAFNEAERIAGRVGNLLASDYPAEKLGVLVVSDGSADDTVVRLRSLAEPRVSILEQPRRMGKAAGLNAALAQCQSEVIVFADARQRFEPATIRNLVRHFADPEVGAVSGSLEIESSASGVGRGVDAYWRMEKRLREDEARFDSCIGCTGAVYALRREFFVPIAEDTLLDDVVIPMHAALRGRILHDPMALAFDPQPLDPAREQARKQRTLAGNFQMLFRYPQWLVPWGHRLWWQLISHKYLRLVSPLLLAVVFASSVVLQALPFYRVALVLQVLFYALAVIGHFAPVKGRLFSLPAGFVFLNAAVVRAFWHFLTGENLHHWSATREKR